jgi:hypothetical protein
MSQQRKRIGRVITGDAAYLLRISQDLFFVKLDGKGDPLGVAIPSVAAHLSYEEADGLCQQVKRKGYNGAVVCDIWGRMMDIKALEVARLPQEQRMNDFWKAPTA